MPLGVVPFPFGRCRICKDRATGLHYGVATCEGCKVCVLYQYALLKFKWACTIW
ncbi:hypothetical protein DPMN_110685 [Dreissena polymorpha]|uniref:Nuclear receptor domain-containing protein n=1 Tax=Dreissena polymorpha TaxID=45954 RepID=A0A9D4QNB4_DREPO|nr:hypothetical protein DPMN_110685 [Dreissena polymorpha]